jgi:hypothetical protein
MENQEINMLDDKLKVNLSDKYENGSVLPEEYVLDTIIKLGVVEQTPVFVFPSGTVAQFMNKLIPLQTQIDKEKIKEGSLNTEEWESFDRKLKELYESQVWVNDREIKSIESYKLAEDIIINEKIKYVFIDSLLETIDKSEIIQWSKDLGFNVYFTKIVYE